MWKVLNFTHFYQFWHPWDQNLGESAFGCVWKYQKLTSRGRKWGSRNKNCHFSINSVENIDFHTFIPIMGQFWYAWGQNLGEAIFGCLKVPKMNFSDRKWVSRKKMITLAPIVWKVLNLNLFFTNFGPILSPLGPKFWRISYRMCLKVAEIDFSG